MATGTGKTVVALAAITHCADVEFIVIAAPTNSLVTQWLGELEKLEGIYSPIEVSGSNPNWPEETFPRLRLAAVGGTQRRPFVFVGTYKSLSGNRFLALLNQIQPAKGLGLLIADEVHNAGAAIYQRLLDPRFDCRLGLGATLERAYDEEGTRVVKDYFEGIVFALGIEDAVGSILCRYHYDVHFVELTGDEFFEYQRLSLKIASLLERQSSKDEQETSPGQPDTLTILLNKRASIVKHAQAKSDFLADLIRQISINKCLFYCADIEQVRIVQRLLTKAGISNLSYTSQESAFARQTALDQLRRNDVQSVVAIKCLDEGIDVPQVHQAILLASSTNEREFVQRRGRILRKAEGKHFARLIDVFTIPPRQYYEDPPTLLFNELKRARILARAADNRFKVENRLIEELLAFGVPIEQTLGA